MAAAHVINRNQPYAKFVSIHPKNKYVEIRSAGNEGYENNIERLINMVTRYAYALSIALDPQAEVREYAKKLYLFLTSFSYHTGDNIDKTKLFAMYAAKMISKDQLMSAVKRANDNELARGGHPSNFGRYVIKVNSPVLQSVFGRDTFQYTDHSPFATDSYQHLMPNIRNYFKSALRAKFLDSENEWPTINVGGEEEMFDPKNRRHLPDSAIEVTKLHT